METKQRILLCEDDESLGMLLRDYLMAKGGAYYTLHNIKSAEASDSNATATPEDQPAEA